MKIRRNHHHTGAPGSDGDLLVGAGHGTEDAGAEAEDHGGANHPVDVNDSASGAGADKGAPAASSGGSKSGQERNGAEPTSRPRGLLGEVLVARGLVTLEQVGLALQLQATSGKKLGEVLVDMDALDERTMVDALADYFGLDVTDLRRDVPDPAALAMIPEDIAREYLAIPVRLEDRTLTVAVAQPSDDLRFLLSETSGCSVRLRLAPLSDIRWAIDRTYQAIGSLDQYVQAFQAVETTRRKTSAKTEAPQVAENAPVVQVVDRILTQAVRDRASDVHIEPSQDAVYIRYRIDGALKDVLELPVSMGTGLVSRIKIMAGIDIVEKRRSQDGQFSTEIDDKGTDVRVSTVATIWGEKCVLRILDKNRSVLRLNELGMPSDTYETYSKLVRAPSGMVLCAGPTGSGKTTTLYATLSEVSDRARNVMTIEDPVEFIFPKINQIQTNESAGQTFATALKSILRQDPDVILVGEIRDIETARIAVQSALTGHFVMSSVHGNDAASALHRFLDMGIESFLISSSVVAIVGQRLLRRICPSCKTNYTPTPDELSFYQANGGSPTTEFSYGPGCNYCGNTGYLDRVGVYELLRMTPEIKRLIVERASQDDLRDQAQSQGMRTLCDEAIALVDQGSTTISEVVRGIYTMNV
jgi:type IV pilus assembly protein PilB